MLTLRDLSRRSKGQHFYRNSILFLALILISACSTNPISPPGGHNTLNPQGPGAAHISSLWWLMFWLGTIIFVLVIVLLVAALIRGRRAAHVDGPPPDEGGDTGRSWIIRGGLIMPLIVLAVVFGYTIYTLAAISPSGDAALKIKVTGRRWWWEVSYPDKGITTADELHIPVGVPVEIQLESGDVIHSFWVPELHGKMDLIPTRVNYLTLQSDTEGVYRGECAEYCGLQHAHMDFMVVVQNSSDFDSWITAQQKPADPPSPNDNMALAGQQVFLDQKCAVCHTVKGLDDRSVDASEVDLGPDLTHIASRLTIAGASLTNNKGNLAGWIVDAQHVKPGSLMPVNYLEPQELQNLLAYLGTLK
jgi:cytochrome c oxidase subunit 2